MDWVCTLKVINGIVVIITTVVLAKRMKWRALMTRRSVRDCGGQRSINRPRICLYLVPHMGAVATDYAECRHLQHSGDGHSLRFLCSRLLLGTESCSYHWLAQPIYSSIAGNSTGHDPGHFGSSRVRKSFRMNKGCQKVSRWGRAAHCANRENLVSYGDCRRADGVTRHADHAVVRPIRDTEMLR